MGKKKIMNWLLCFAMVFSLLPTASFAAGNEIHLTGAITENVTWNDGDVIFPQSNQIFVGDKDNPDKKVVITVNGTVTLTASITCEKGNVTIKGGTDNAKIVFDETKRGNTTGASAVINVANGSNVDFTVQNLVMQFTKLTAANGFLHAAQTNCENVHVTFDNVELKDFNFSNGYLFNWHNNAPESFKFTLRNTVKITGTNTDGVNTHFSIGGSSFHHITLDNFSSGGSPIKVRMRQAIFDTTTSMLLATGAVKANKDDFTFISATNSGSTYSTPITQNIYYTAGELHIGKQAPTATKWEIDLGTAPSGGNIASATSNLRQLITKGQAIEPIVITPKSGYTFAGANTTALSNALSGTGLTVSVDSNGALKISGTPNKDVMPASITWPTPVEDSFTVSLPAPAANTGLTLVSATSSPVQSGGTYTATYSVADGYILDSAYLNKLNNTSTGLLKGTGLTASIDGGKLKISGTITHAVSVSGTWPALSAVEAVIGSVKYDKLSDAINAAASGQTVEMKKNPTTAVSNAALKSGATLQDTNGNTYTAEGGNAKVDVATNGTVTLKEGKLNVSVGGSVGVVGKNNASHTLTGDSAFTAQAGENASVTIPASGGTVRDGNIFYQAGGANSTFLLDGTDLSGNASGDKIAVGADKNTDTDVKLSDTVTVKLPANQGGMVTKGDGTANAGYVTLDQNETFTVGGKTYTAGAGDTQFEIGVDGSVKLVSGSATLGDGESLTGAKSGLTIENPAASNDDTVTVEAVEASEGESYDLVTVPESGSVKIGDTTYANESTTDALKLKVFPDGTVAIAEGTFSKSLSDGQSTVGFTSGATIANPDASGNDTITIVSDAEKDRVTVPASTENSVTIEQNGVSTTYTNSAPRCDQSPGAGVRDLVIDVTADGASLVSGYVALDQNESIGVWGNTITNTSEDSIVVEKNSASGSAAILLAAGQSFTDKDGNTYTAKVDGTIFDVNTDGTITLRIGSADVTPAANKTAAVQVRKSPTGSDCYAVSGDKPFTVTAGGYEADEKATVTIPTAGDSVNSAANDGSGSKTDLTFTAGQNGSTFLLDGSELNNQGDKLTVGKDTTVDISTDIGGNIDGNGTPNTVKVPKENTGDVTIEKNSPSVITVSNADDKVVINGKTYEVKQDNTVLTVDEDGTVRLIQGEMILPAGESIEVAGSGAAENDMVFVTNDTASDMTISAPCTPDATVTHPDGSREFYDRLDRALDAVTSGDTVTLPEGTVTPVTNDTLKGGVTLVSGDGTRYEAEVDATVSVDATGEVTLNEGKLNVSGNGPVNVEKSGSIAYRVSSDTVPPTDFTVDTGAADGKETVSIKHQDGNVNSTFTTGSGKGDLHFAAGQDGSSFPLDGSKLNNNGDKLTVVGENTTKDITTDIGGDIDGNGTPNTVTVPADNAGDVSIEKNSPSVITVSNANDKIVINGKEYTVKQDNTILTVDEDGTVTLVEGAVELDQGEDIFVKPDAEGERTKVKNPTANSNKVTVTAPASVEVKGNDTVEIGDTAYTAKADTTFTVGESGEAAITAGKSELDKGESLIAGKSGVAIRNSESNGDDTKITVTPDSGADKVTVPEGAKVTIGDTEYTNPVGDGKDLILAIAPDGTVSIENGDVELDRNEGITLNGTEIKNTEDTAIIVSKDPVSGEGTLDVKEGGAFAVGDSGTVISSKQDTTFAVDADGNIVIDLEEGKTVTINEVEYTGGPAQIIVDKDGNIADITGTCTVTIPDDALSRPNFKYSLRPGESLNIGGYIYTAPNGVDSKVGDVCIAARQDENGAALTPVVTVKKQGDTVNVALSADPAVNTDYTAANAETRFAMAKNDQDTTQIDLLDNGKSDNSALKVTDDKMRTVNGVSYKGGAAEGMTPEYTVELNKNAAGAVSNKVTVASGSKVTATMNTNDCITVNDASKLGEESLVAATEVVSKRDGTEIVIDNTDTDMTIAGSGNTRLELVKDDEGNVIGVNALKNGSVTPEHTPNIRLPKTEHGAFAVNPNPARTGENVTITVTPELGYKLESISVTDPGGVPVEVVKTGENTYTFVMPLGGANVYGGFTKSEGSFLNCQKNDKCPLHAFADTDPKEWYHDGVHFCLENGLMNGYDNGTFGIADEITRGQLVAILWRYMGCPEASVNSFPDVNPEFYYAQAIRWAADNGIVLGYDTGDFGPDDSVTREQLAAILYRFAKLLGVDVTVSGEHLNGFSDHAQVMEYALPAVQWAAANGIMQGVTETTLEPQGTGIRAQVAVLMQRFLTGLAK